MANIRTLKLNLLADTDNFSKGLKKASGQTNSFSSSITSSMKKIGKSAVLAGVAVAGLAVAYGVDAVKAAIEDQKSQKQLQVTLKNTTKATDKQVKAVEKYITKTQFAYGIADDKLRPALARLTRATGNVTKAQDLLSLALDVSAGTGKSLDSVTQALSRAQNGNLSALKKLGVPLSDTIIKTKDLTAATKIMGKTFGGAAAANADTLAGKMDIFKQRINEAKETIGTSILTAFQPLAEKYLPKIAKAFTQIIDGVTGGKGKGPAYNIGKAIGEIGTAIKLLFEAFTTKGNGQVKTFAENMQTLADVLNNVAAAIRGLATAIGYIKGGLNTINKFFNFGYNLGNKISDPFGSNTPPPTRPNGGGGGSYARGRQTVINLNGIVDAESARRTIENLLQQSSIRTGTVNVNRVAI
jgi:hypothetical protein